MSSSQRNSSCGSCAVCWVMLPILGVGRGGAGYAGRMDSTPTTKGHLTPGPSAVVTRLPVPGDLVHLVRQVWIPEWDLPAGERMEELGPGYPAGNLVVEPHGTGLYGPTSRASVKVLTGRGWAVGALLRP